ncbi:hypothetical protein FSP39_008115 [Pinctada imbricata]|uniref:Sodium-coupled monocarboxylate transporter 1 n=1 Tax=Pinctada imbricata TaxID=66713 RepID=A0AA88Y8K6_PINIB|nr:hypothetical protein FSP39_008115 [Pinctada imbricata]
MEDSQKFEIADWAVFIIILIISASIGIYHAFSGGRQKTTKEFLMGNRKMSLLPVAASILVSFLSAILILGAPAEMYTRGTQYYLYLFGQMLAVVLATVLFVPLFYPLKLTSMYEYVELRFKSRATRLTATGINIVSTLIYTGIASFAPATALNAASGFPEWGSFILIGFVCTFYTFMGGIKAVVWVDAFQALIMLSGLLTIVIKATLSVGGFGEVWRLNEEWKRIDFWNFDPDPTVRHTFWALVIGGMINWTGTFGASQQSIQRFSALSTLKQAKIAVLLNCIGLFVMSTSACLAGVSVFAYFAMIGCDPLASKKIKNVNQLIPYFVSEVLGYPGIPGLFIACLFSGALSSISSNISSLVATSWEDIVKPLVKLKPQHVQTWIAKSLGKIVKPLIKLKPKHVQTWIAKSLVILYGCLGVGVAFLVKNLGGTVLQASLSFMGAAAGALNGVVVLGAFFPWCNWIGALAGPLASYAVMMWIGIANYSVRGAKKYLPSPTSECSANQNYSAEILSATMRYSPLGNASNIVTDLVFSNRTDSILYNSSDMTTIYPMLGSTSSLFSDSAFNNTTSISLIMDSTSNLTGLDRLYSLSYLWYSTLGIIISIAVGMLVSFLTGKIVLTPVISMVFYTRHNYMYINSSRDVSKLSHR